METPTPRPIWALILRVQRQIRPNQQSKPRIGRTFVFCSGTYREAENHHKCYFWKRAMVEETGQSAARTCGDLGSNMLSYGYVSTWTPICLNIFSCKADSRGYQLQKAHTNLGTLFWSWCPLRNKGEKEKSKGNDLLVC